MSFRAPGALIRLRPGGRDLILFNGPRSSCPELPAGLAACVELFAVHGLTVCGGLALHAAAFELGGEGVLAVGRSGSGKSTLALAALAAGGRVVSDDTVVVFRQGSEGELCAAPLRPDLSLRRGSLGLLPSVQEFNLAQSSDGRTILRRSQHPSLFIDNIVVSQVWFLSEEAQKPGKSLSRTIDSQADTFTELLCASAPLLLSSKYDVERTIVMKVATELMSVQPSLRVWLGWDLLEKPREILGRLLRGRPRDER